MRIKFIDYEHYSCLNSLVFDMFNKMLQLIYCQIIITVFDFADINESVVVQIVEVSFV